MHYRSTQKIEKLGDALKKLQEDNISAQCSNLLDSKFSGLSLELLKNQLKNVRAKNKKGQRYSDEVKKLAFTMHFYSPAAYEYLRSIFLLPHARSLRQWASSVQSEPGFFIDVMKELQNRVASGSINKDCALMLDAMHIRSRAMYNKSLDKYEGFINFGPDLDLGDANREVLATEALVFMLVGLTGRWKFPIGYFLINKIDADVQSHLVQIALNLSHEHGLLVHTITCDCTSVNPKTMALLGCQWLGPNPQSQLDVQLTNRREVHLVLDACHVLKLARNALAELKLMRDGDGNAIKWDHICLLNEIQRDEGLKFANKLGAKHTNFQQHKMKVNVAAQTLSSSIADAIEFLMDRGIPGFEDATGTVSFIRVVDRLFDFLNSRSRFSKGYKQPVSKNSLQFWAKVVETSVKYLKQLRGP